MDDVAIEKIAACCHEANRAYCRGLGDDSQVSWFDAPVWQKKSAFIRGEGRDRWRDAGAIARIVDGGQSG